MRKVKCLVTRNRQFLVLARNRFCFENKDKTAEIFLRPTYSIFDNVVCVYKDSLAKTYVFNFGVSPYNDNIPLSHYLEDLGPTTK